MLIVGLANVYGLPCVCVCNCVCVRMCVCVLVVASNEWMWVCLRTRYVGSYR